MPRLVKVVTQIELENWVEVNGTESSEEAARQAEAYATETLARKLRPTIPPRSDAVQVRDSKREEGAPPAEPGCRIVRAPVGSEPVHVPDRPPEAKAEGTAPPPASIPEGGVIADRNLFGLLLQLRAAISDAMLNDDDPLAAVHEIIQELDALVIRIPPPADLAAAAVAAVPASY